MYEPTCPKCGDTIEQFDTIDTYYDDDECELFVIGECPKCGQQYRWREVYCFRGIRNLEEFNE